MVFAHPEQHSFNGQLKDVIAKALRERGDEVEFSDLYAMGFDPVEAPKYFSSRKLWDRFDVQMEQRHAYEGGTTSSDVKAEIDKLCRADLVIFQFPIWWFSIPAILKGWLDRVLVYGLYTGKKRYGAGYFAGRRVFVSVTAGGPESTFAYNGRNGDIDLLLWPLHFTLHYMGYEVLPPFCAFGIAAAIRYGALSADDARLSAYKEGLRKRILDLDRAVPLKFNDWQDWDEIGRLRAGVPSYSAFMRQQQ